MLWLLDCIHHSNFRIFSLVQSIYSIDTISLISSCALGRLVPYEKLDDENNPQAALLPLCLIWEVWLPCSAQHNTSSLSCLGRCLRAVGLNGCLPISLRQGLSCPSLQTWSVLVCQNCSQKLHKESLVPCLDWLKTDLSSSLYVL